MFFVVERVNVENNINKTKREIKSLQSFYFTLFAPDNAIKLILSGENMIVTDKMLKEKYHNYVNVYSKINSEIKKENLIRVVRGIYETNPNVSNYLL